jgi:hypothetical protein
LKCDHCVCTGGTCSKPLSLSESIFVKTRLVSGKQVIVAFSSTGCNRYPHDCPKSGLDIPPGFRKRLVPDG